MKEPEAPANGVTKVTVTFNGDPVSSKGFTWYTPLASGRSDLQVVEKTGNTADFAKAASFSGRTSVARNSVVENVHKAEAIGLKADAIILPCW